MHLCVVSVCIFADSAVPHEPSGVPGGAQGEVESPLLTKQRANTESLPHESSQDIPNNKYNTPVKGRPRPVLPKKQSTGTAGTSTGHLSDYRNYLLKSKLFLLLVIQSEESGSCRLDCD